MEFSFGVYDAYRRSFMILLIKVMCWKINGHAEI